jgi:hypothetical protein
VEVTLFFKEQQLQFSISSCLTIMLVMYTMFQGVNNTLPGTAYLKFIDVWLLFCLTMPFVVFLTEIAWEMYINKQTNGTGPQNGWLKDQGSERSSGIPHKAATQCIIIGLTILFILCYAALALAYFWNLV